MGKLSFSSMAQFVVGVLVAGALASPQVARATTGLCYVKAGIGGPHTGASWATAYAGLQPALGNSACTEVWVAAGVYKPGTGQDATFSLRAGVAVYGGFAGTETLRSQRNPATHVTILSGDIDNNDVNTDGNHIDENTTHIKGSNSFRVVTIDGTSTAVTASTVLDGFTITGGDGTSGAGVFCIGSGAGHTCSPTFAQLRLSGNRATWGGGMMNYADSGGVSSPTLTNITFTGNSSTNQGGGLYNSADGGTSSPTLTNVTFTYNKSGSGGAMCNLGADGGHSNPSLTNTIFRYNQASSYGGAIFNNGAPGGAANAKVTRAVFFKNSAQMGGAIYNDGGAAGHSSPTLIDVTFSSNKASLGGGAMFNNGIGGTSSPSLKRVTFSGNTSGAEGGAIYNRGESGGNSSPTLVDVTFSGNSAFGSGGAIHDDGWQGTSSPKLKNVTMIGNSAIYGGAMSNNGSSGISNPVISNAILWGNTASSSNPEIINTSGTPVIDHSIVQGSKPGGVWETTLGTDLGGNLDADPKLNALGNYGGLTKTMTLKMGSPAIDRGTNTGCPAVDQRGIARPLDGDGSGTKICDMGATESQFVTKSLSSTGTYDGWVLESGENTSLGGSLNSTATTFNLGDDASNRQYRSILSFKTLMPSSVTIVSATLKIKKASLVGANPFNTLGNILVDIKKGAFSNSAPLQTSDFQAAPSKSAAATITNTPAAGWYSKALPSTSFGYINKSGITQFRLRFATDDNNNHVADYLKFYSGNYGTASSRPQLVLKYYVP